ncbi:hypothetical protein [Nocardiopsis sp. RV163]|uniref:hypothetical protein n=1 Tax=Nocardiopsis sp. RV163 TaxID=1661388 RepID=UPI000A603FA1|nr:hypothetical protein [Nocardiopsis sp. RV163]
MPNAPSGTAAPAARALIVEDEADILGLLTASLELSGFATRGAPDAGAAAPAALAALDGFPPTSPSWT